MKEKRIEIEYKNQHHTSKQNTQIDFRLWVWREIDSSPGA